MPSLFPTVFPTYIPSYAPSLVPTFVPSYFPTLSPSPFPTWDPSVIPTFSPSFLPTAIDTSLYQALALETLIRQQDYAQMTSLILNETTIRKAEVLRLQSTSQTQKTGYFTAMTNITHQCLALEIKLNKVRGNDSLSVLPITRSLSTEIQKRKLADAQLIQKLNQKAQQCREDKNALLSQLYALTHLMQQWVHIFNTSLQEAIHDSNTAVAQLTAKIQFFTTSNHQELTDSHDQLTENFSLTNASIHEDVHTLWLGLRKQLDSVSSSITQQTNTDIQTLQAIIDSIKPNSVNNTVIYKIPERFVTDIVARQAASIAVLDNPHVQEARRLFDFTLSLKECTLICIAIFNFLILVQGMSIIQSLRYSFYLKEKKELDSLRRGSAGPVGPDFDTFVTRLEEIIVHSTFTTKERADRLRQLTSTQGMKADSLSLFSSLHGLHELRIELKNSQELSAVGLLREVDLSRKTLADEIYTSYKAWRRVNRIRTLIYSILRPYSGNVERDENEVLGRNEKWSSRFKHREKIELYWAIFHGRLLSQSPIQPVSIGSPAAIILKMAVEFDEKTSPDFSRYLHKLHKKLCLLSYLPSMVEDLSFHTNEDRTIDFNIYIEHAKQCLKEASELMEDIHRLTKPRSYWDIRLFSSSRDEAEKIRRRNIAVKLYEILEAVNQHMIDIIPLLTVWMDKYLTIATHAETPFNDQLTLVYSRIDQSHEEATKYEQTYHDMICALSTDPGLPGVTDLIDLSFHLDLKLDQSHLSERLASRRIALEPIPPEDRPSEDRHDFSDSDSGGFMSIRLSDDDEDIDVSLRNMMRPTWDERSSDSDIDSDSNSSSSSGSVANNFKNLRNHKTDFSQTGLSC